MPLLFPFQKGFLNLKVILCTHHLMCVLVFLETLRLKGKTK